MGTATLQVRLNDKRLIDLAAIRDARGVPDSATNDSVGKVLLLEKIDEELARIRKAAENSSAKSPASTVTRNADDNK